MILDYNKGKEFMLANGVRFYNVPENTIMTFFGVNARKDETLSERFNAHYSHKIFKDITFKNFPNLQLNNSTLENCKFINCSLENKQNFLSSCQYNSFFVKGREVENLAESCVVI